MKFKKADLSIQTIVVAAIALMVLLVIIFIFTRSMRDSGGKLDDLSDSIGGLTDCDSKLLKRSCQTSCSGNDKKIVDMYSCRDGYVCCEGIYPPPYS
ncbi:hypothetical protein GOV05_03125 [Candidatus Woesearchaeota archaeon]|nr:hypothetical protein [Candidatus Woesearchaeota archaeon]